MGNLVHAVLRSSVPDLQQARTWNGNGVFISQARSATTHGSVRRNALCALPSQELKGEERAA
jgi:hypothetical protein